MSNMEEGYFLSLIKNISWKLNNLFTPNDKADIMRSVLIDEKEATLLTETGTTKNNADERNKGMWRSLNATITGKPGNTVEHYFENIYKKLACCTGKDNITVPILKRNETTGKIERIYKTIRVDRNKECTMNGVNWKDDNTTEAGYNSNCEDLMQRLIAFLSKYDPENPMIDSYGGCLANKHLDSVDPEIRKDPFLLNLVNTNRSCLMPSCNNPDAYKRKQDRKSCETTICQANVGVSESQAAGAISVFGNQIEQHCGPQSEIKKSLEKGEEKAKEIIKEKKEEVEKAKEIIKEIKEKEEVEQTEKKVDKILSDLKTFFNNLFQSFINLFKKTEQFNNFNFNILNQISGINYPKYLFLATIFIIIPVILIGHIKIKK